MNIINRLGLEEIAGDIRVNFLLDIMAAGFWGLFGGAVLPFLAPVFRQCGASEMEVSLILSAPFIGMLFSPLWTYLSAKYNPVKVVMWADSLSRISLFFLL